jgi:hypothetical protein
MVTADTVNEGGSRQVRGRHAYVQGETLKACWPGDIEPVLLELAADINILRHIPLSSVDIDENELLRVKNGLELTHDRLKQLWRQAFHARVAENRAHAAALEAAQARKAAPGSAADLERVESLWRLLRAAAGTALEAVKAREVAP